MDIYKIPCLFGLPEAGSLSELSAGHINRTFLAVCGGEKYVLQTLNRSVFHSPETVMYNISRIEAAFAENAASDTAVPHFIAAGDKNFAVADDEVWRMYKYISATADAAANAAAAGRAFGTFIRVMNGRELSDAPVIENFHNFNRYFSVLTTHKGIASDILAKLDKLRDTLGQVFTDSLKKRVIHGDAKADNVIISERSTIIDLDTVMYGYAAIDYGDLVRSVCRSGLTDMKAVKAVTCGFLQGLDGLLTNDEINSMYYGVLWLTGELAMRYLIDSRSEIRYFRGKSPAECRSRAEELLSQLDGFIAAEADFETIILN
ncbi:MAG: aminoglycoside phosphotransferase family protein [Ruminococcus sp.]|uniref:phosphotransferase n=1 Tax=Ruminococcus sp. TaxID=41978 RepID=UPI0025DB5885|nr:phosphotransferase [Ruminococcus sp.]MCR5599175.1 aminoglycoside phosphotransferase family protein [Ruminococcus sp.]